MWPASHPGYSVSASGKKSPTTRWIGRRTSPWTGLHGVMNNPAPFMIWITIVQPVPSHFTACPISFCLPTYQYVSPPSSLLVIFPEVRESKPLPSLGQWQVREGFSYSEFSRKLKHNIFDNCLTLDG
jgi:hypothetical protein